MTDINISLEATCDLSKELINKYNFKVIDMDFLIDGEVYNTSTDTVLSTKLYEKMRNGARTSTSQVNEQIYVEHFTELLKEGKDVLHLAFSSGLSNTYNSAKQASEKVNKGSKNKVYVVDTLCACSGTGMLAILVHNYCLSAKNIKQVVEYVESIKLKLNHCFSVDNLKYLANGGRLKSSAAIMGNLLNIKPVMRMDNAGKLENVKKVFSRKKALSVLANEMLERYDPAYDICFISHADCLEDANYIADIIKSKINIEIFTENLGPVIGSHSGPGTIAVYYIAESR